MKIKEFFSLPGPRRLPRLLRRPGTDRQKRQRHPLRQVLLAGRRGPPEGIACPEGAPSGELRPARSGGRCRRQRPLRRTQPAEHLRDIRRRKL